MESGRREGTRRQHGRWWVRYPVPAVVAVVIAAALPVLTARDAGADFHVPVDPCIGGVLLTDPSGRLLNAPERVIRLATTSGQRAALCRFEGQVLAKMAADRGVPDTPEERARLVSWGRNDVRANVFAALLDAAARPPAQRSADEQVAVEWFQERVRQLLILSAQTSKDEYNRWNLNPCKYVPPPGFHYDPGCFAGGLLSIFTGPPSPPSYEEFVKYGAHRSMQVALDLDAQVAVGKTSLALTTLAVASAAMIGAGLLVVVPALATAAVVGVSTLTSFVFPFTLGVVAGAMAAAALVVVLLIVVAAIRGVQVFEDAKIPQRLDEDLALAQATPDLVARMQNTSGMAVLFAAFIDATMPEAHPPAPAAPTAPSGEGFLVTGADGRTTFEQVISYREAGNTVNRAWRQDGWWVVEPGDGSPNRLALSLLHEHHRGGTWAATLKGADTLVDIDTKATAAITGCPAQSCEIGPTLRFWAPTGDAERPFEKASARLDVHTVQITSGPTVSGTSAHGQTVTLSANAATTGPAGGAISYRWQVSRASARYPGKVVEVSYEGNEVQHTFLGGGTYTIQVTATDALGLSATAQTQVQVQPSADVGITTRQLVRDDQRLLGGEWLESWWYVGTQQYLLPPHFAPPGGTIIPSSEAALEVQTDSLLETVISVDWDLDGTWDDQRTVTGTPALFTPPIYGRYGVHPARVRAVTDDGATGEEVVPIEVSSLPPDAPDLEVWVDGDWVDPATSPVPVYRRGDQVRIRFRLSHPATDEILDARVFWLLDGATHELEGLEEGEWHEVSYLVTRSIDGSPPRSAAILQVTDQAGISGLAPSFLLFDVEPYHVDVIDHDVTVDADGVASLYLDYLDVFRDAHRATIDWGDGSTPQEIGLPLDASALLTSPSGPGSSVETIFEDIEGLLGPAPRLDRIVGEHRYAEQGHYTVSVRLFNDLPNPPPIEMEAHVGNRRPVLEDVVLFDLQPEGSLSRLVLEASDPEDDVETLGVTVDWGDGGAPELVGYDAELGGFPAEHRYADNGDYDLVLAAVDPHGATSLTVNVPLSVDNAAPRITEFAVLDETGAPVGGPTSVVVGQPLHAHVDFVDDGSLDTHDVLVDWGDGTVTAAQHETGTGHAYAAGGTYDVTVTVTDNDGDSDSDSVELHVLSTSGAPTSVRASPGDRQASVSWLPPPDPGNTPISQYEVECVADGAAAPTRLVTTGSSPATVGQLTNGVMYRCTVRARNTAGLGPPSAAALVTPAKVPSAPRSLQGTAQQRRIDLSWTEPSDSGGLAVETYEARCARPGGAGARKVTTAQTRARFDDMALGSVYECSVRARNAVGFGPTSRTVTVVTPVAPVPPPPTKPGTAPTFTDVPQGTYFAEAVAWLAARGVTKGLGGGRFGPHEPASRAQIVTFLHRYAGEPRPTGPHFADVPPSAYFSGPSRWARQAGITTGVGGTNNFAPHRLGTRAEFVTFLWRYAGKPSAHGLPRFGDVPAGAYYEDATRWARKHGITTGVGGTNRFDPDGLVTRAQVAAMLHRFATA